MREFDNRRVAVVHDHHGIGEGGYLASKIVRYIFGILETALALRLVLLLFGASTASGFVSFIYNLTEPFVAPFRGIVQSFYAPGIASQSILEPATIIAMLVYGLIAWGLLSLVRTLSHSVHSRHYR